MWDLIVSVPDHCLSFYFCFKRKHSVYSKTRVALFVLLDHDTGINTKRFILYNNKKKIQSIFVTNMTFISSREVKKIYIFHSSLMKHIFSLHSIK